MSYLTDSELVDRYEYYTMQLEERLLQGEDYKTLIDEIPCMAVVSRSEDIEILYTNKKHEKLSGYSTKKVRAECPEYLNKVIHPTSLRNVRRLLQNFYKTQKPRCTSSFIQYAKLRGDTDHTPLITFTKPPKERDGLVIRMPVMIEEFGKHSKKMEQIVRMDQFKLKHFRRFQQLTDREVEVLKLLANGRNNPQIAEELFLSRQTVETHRKHLKRKLELLSFLDLMRYAFAFNLVEY